MAAMRSEGSQRPQGPESKAVRAVPTAASTSAGPAAATCAMDCSVCGEMTSKTFTRPSLDGNINYLRLAVRGYTVGPTESYYRTGARLCLDFPSRRREAGRSITP